MPLFVGAKGDFRWVIAGSEQLRLSLFDSPTVTIVVDVDAFDGGRRGSSSAAWRARRREVPAVMTVGGITDTTAGDAG